MPASDAGPAKMNGTIKVGAPIGAQGEHGRNLVRGDWGTEVIEELTPLGRVGQPEEIPALVVYLCSRASSYVTGCVAVIDGGLTLQ